MFQANCSMRTFSHCLCSSLCIFRVSDFKVQLLLQMFLQGHELKLAQQEDEDCQM